MTSAAGSGVKWSMEADYLQACNGDYGCPCEFEAPPTMGFCEGIGAWRINQSRYGDTALDGLEVQRAQPAGGEPEGVTSGGAVNPPRCFVVGGRGRGYNGSLCGSSSAVEHLLAKEGVASSNLVFRSS